MIIHSFISIVGELRFRSVDEQISEEFPARGNQDEEHLPIIFLGEGEISALTTNGFGSRRHDDIGKGRDIFLSPNGILLCEEKKFDIRQSMTKKYFSH